MNCPECDGDRFVIIVTELAQTINGDHRVFVGVPALKCSQCRHLVLPVATVESMERAVRRPPNGMMQVPVFDLAEKQSWRISTRTAIQEVGTTAASARTEHAST